MLTVHARLMMMHGFNGGVLGTETRRPQQDICNPEVLRIKWDGHQEKQVAQATALE